MSAFHGPIENVSIAVHDPNVPFPDGFSYDDANGHFGVVNIKVHSDVAIPTGVYLVNMEKDGSGSMTCRTNDGRSRDDHVKATICNAIRALTKIATENPHIQIYVKLSDFDTSVYSVLELSQVSCDNVERLVSTIMNRQLPNQSTNLEAALRDSVQSCDAFLAMHPDAHILSVLTTDGEANNGECNKYRLQEIVQGRSYPTVCVGYGAEHNADLLITVGSSYFYVADLERAGEPVGEILQNFLFIAMENGKLEIRGGEIWDGDCWTDVLYLGNVIGGSCKTYSVRSTTPEVMSVHLYGRRARADILENTAKFPGSYTDLTRDAFRHETVILLKKARDMLAVDHVGPVHPEFSDKYAADMERYEGEMTAYEQRLQAHTDEKKVLRDKIKVFFRLMKDYAKDKKMEHEALMKQLLDDVYTVWLAMSSRFTKNEARAFTQAKYMCNDRQLSNNTSARSATQTTPMRMPRQHAGVLQTPRHAGGTMPVPMLRTPTCMSHPGMQVDETEEEEEDEDDLEYELTDGAVSAYATQASVSMMREVSSSRSY
jgi:hypothetical protein